jgi:hypothetical protein
MRARVGTANDDDDDDVVLVSESAPAPAAVAVRLTERERTRRERVARCAGGLGLESGTNDGASAQAVVGKCAICLDAYVNATSTRCGHVFCARCIAAAHKHNGKCPTCRKKVDKKSLHRIFL